MPCVLSRYQERAVLCSLNLLSSLPHHKHQTAALLVRFRVLDFHPPRTEEGQKLCCTSPSSRPSAGKPILLVGVTKQTKHLIRKLDVIQSDVCDTGRCSQSGDDRWDLAVACLAVCDADALQQFLTQKRPCKSKVFQQETKSTVARNNEKPFFRCIPVSDSEMRLKDWCFVSCMS